MRVISLVSLALALAASSMPLSARSNDVVPSQGGTSGAIGVVNGQDGTVVHAVGATVADSTGTLNVVAGDGTTALHGSGSTNAVGGSLPVGGSAGHSSGRRSTPGAPGVNSSNVNGATSQVTDKVKSTTGGHSSGVNSTPQGHSLGSRSTTGAPSGAGGVTKTVTNGAGGVGKLTQGNSAVPAAAKGAAQGVAGTKAGSGTQRQ